MENGDKLPVGKSINYNLNDFENTNTLGLQLVNALVKQIYGTIELYRDKGTTFKIIF